MAIVLGEFERPPAGRTAVIDGNCICKLAPDEYEGGRRLFANREVSGTGATQDSPDQECDYR